MSCVWTFLFISEMMHTCTQTPFSSTPRSLGAERGAVLFSYLLYISIISCYTSIPLGVDCFLSLSKTLLQLFRPSLSRIMHSQRARLQALPLPLWLQHHKLQLFLLQHITAVTIEITVLCVNFLLDVVCIFPSTARICCNTMSSSTWL